MRSVGEGILPGCVAKLTKRFADIVKLLQKSKGPGDPFWKAADQLLTFPEFPQLCLGYGTKNSHGRGQGTEIRREVLAVGKAIVDAGVDDPAFFELVGLFQEGVGADLLSDMTAHVLIDDLVAYTERALDSLGVKCKEIDDGMVRGRLLMNPFRSKTAVLLAPRLLLRDLPVARDWSDVDLVSAHNEELRKQVNKVIGGTWKKAISIQKKQLREAILDKPELLWDLVTQYKKKRGEPYDFASDPSGRARWHELAREVAQQIPLNLHLAGERGQDVLDVALTLCGHFKHLVEQRKWWTLLYKEDGRPKREEAAQLLFFGIAEVYVRIAGLGVDVSREPHVGRGAVDFKVVSGSARALVEVKLTSNSNLVRGYTEQLPAYGEAERTAELVYLVALREVVAECTRKSQQAPQLFEVDGTKRASASKE